MNECKKKIYKSNNVIFQGTLVCWGGFGQPTCKFLEQCISDYQNILTKRKYNFLIERAKKMSLENKCQK